MEPDSYGELKKKRGVWAHLSVSPKADANTIQKLAIEKHASLDQFFCGLEDYVWYIQTRKFAINFLPVKKIFLLNGTNHF